MDAVPLKPRQEPVYSDPMQRHPDGSVPGDRLYDLLMRVPIVGLTLFFLVREVNGLRAARSACILISTTTRRSSSTSPRASR